mgnify:CR=1 FL=1
MAKSADATAKSIKAELTFKKETAGAAVYVEQDEEGAFRQIYLRKANLPKPLPHKIQLTVAWE